VAQIALDLGGRSSGAVGQACDKLVKLGHASVNILTARRYAATPAGIAAHQTAPTAAPPVVAPQTPPPGSTRTTSSPTAAPGAPAAHRPSPAKAGPAKTSGPVIRPNGQTYHPRSLAGRRDVDVLADLRHKGVPVLLYGPPGTGKTSLIEAAFGADLHTVAGDGDTTVGDIVGDYVPTDDGGYKFVPGALPTAMETGGVLFIDDATLISPKVLAVVYPAMDGRRQITLKADGGRIVTAADGFYVVAGHNPGVHGAVLTEALSSRFSAQIEVSTDYDLAIGLGVDTRAVRAARNLSTLCASGEIGWAPQLRELLAFKKIADALGVEHAVANLAGIAPAEDRDAVLKVLTGMFGLRSVTTLALGKQL
jgi:hypothetical protein